MNRLLQALCLKPQYSLRRQMFAAYGVTSAIAIGVVMIVAMLTVRSSGEEIQQHTRDLLREQVVASTLASSEHAANTLSKKLENLQGVASLLVQATRDRIVGYPGSGWEDDRHVPFFDTFTGRNVYPLKSDSLPLDWNISRNVDQSNYQEHLQDRYTWYSEPITTANAVYRVQGECDPSETDPASNAYYENCTDANNDIVTGGVVQPTSTSRYLKEKSADLAVFLKPLYESHPDVKLLGIYFANSGAGSSVAYPGTTRKGLSSYRSIGCEWMREINPNTGSPYGTEEEIQRCHPKGSQVPGREYNPLERQWCRDQALSPGRAHIVGPYKGAFTGLWLITVGEAVFDKMTGHFLACTLLDVSIAHIADIVSTLQAEEGADVAMARWEDGTIVSSNKWDTNAAEKTMNVVELEFMDMETFDHLRSLVDFTSQWDPVEVRDVFRENVFKRNGKLVAAFPIPKPPLVYDSIYRPEFMVIQSVGEEIYSLIDETESSIHEEVHMLYYATISIGLLGLAVVLIVSWTVASFLTHPLQWMMRVARRIVQSDDEVGGSIYANDDDKPFLRCTPKTEITLLVSEFQSIIQGFSGDGPASVASPTVNDVFNTLSWKEDFAQGYLDLLYEDKEEEPEQLDSRTSSIGSHQSMAALLSEVSETLGDGRGSQLITHEGETDLEAAEAQPLRSLREEQPSSSDSVLVDAASGIDGGPAMVTHTSSGITNEGETDLEAAEAHPLRSLREEQPSSSDSVLVDAASGIDGGAAMVTQTSSGMRASALACPRDSHQQPDVDDNLGDGIGSEARPSAGESVSSIAATIHLEERQALETSGGHSVMAYAVEMDEAVVDGSTAAMDTRASTRSARSSLATSARGRERPGYWISDSGSTRVNKGRIASGGQEDASAELFEDELKNSLALNQVRRSPLFWWIVVLIVAPVLLTMAFICTIVTVKVADILPSWLERVESASTALEVEFVKASATSRAAFAKEILVEPIRDLHLFTRIVSWLLFGGVVQSRSFTSMTQSTEECKSTPNGSTCDFFLNKTRAPCDCNWEDPNMQECEEFPNDSRYLQRQFYACQAQDADPNTGARNSTSFPLVDSSPGSTLWWDDATKMPGALNSSMAYGYSTVYDRTRVLSAAAIASIPIYNYRHGSRKKHLGVYVGMEAEGMILGYTGCDYSFSGYSHWQSTTENGASKISPNLCPLGKFGYDSRCRGWYDEGKRADTLHLTAPYVFAGNHEIANSATFPLIDPSTGVHVGQTLVDFFPTLKWSSATRKSSDSRLPNSFVIVITPESDALGGDTMVGPGYNASESASPPIQDLVLPCDAVSTKNRKDFDQDVLLGMKMGNASTMTFRRRTFTGSGENLKCKDKEETMLISYAPIRVRAMRPLSSDDFARGVHVSEKLLSSLGVVVPVNDLRVAFAYTEDCARSKINRSIAILIGLVAATAVIATVALAMVSRYKLVVTGSASRLLTISFFLVLESKITYAMVRPVTILLEFVRLINKKHILHDIPPMQGGSREVNQLYASFAKLHKIVRFSNLAFFSGKMKSAYGLLTDALSLFRRAEDQKAIGIADNNLGNTLLAMRNQKLSTGRCFQIDGSCAQKLALQSYDESISLTMDEYEKSSLSAENDDRHTKLAEQLANRLFNRGLFFLLTAKDKCATNDAIEKGHQDLVKARELDCEIRNIWVETRQIHKNSVRYFERLLRRAVGLIGLMRQGVIEDASWNIAELLDEANSLLFVVWNVPGSPLFHNLSPTGRLQQLEAIAIRFELCRGDVGKAAFIATRMLVQDEYIESYAFSAAASAFLTCFRKMPPPECLKQTESTVRADLRWMLQNCKTSCDVDIGKNVILLHDLARHDDCHDIVETFVRKLSESCYDDDFVVTSLLDGCNDGESLMLRRKGDIPQGDWPRGCDPCRIKDINASFHRAIGLVAHSEEACENDSWIILTTDRSRWDSPQVRGGQGMVFRSFVCQQLASH